MKGLQSIGAALAFIVSFLLMRIVVHGYAHHDQLDVFHLIVAIGSTVAGLLLLRRIYLSRS